MTEEEAQKVLDELNTVRIEVLNDEAKKLFEAIMKIADERDKLKEELDLKNKIINLMSEQFAGLTIFDIDKDEPLTLSDKEEVKQYFENKAKEKRGGYMISEGVKNILKKDMKKYKTLVNITEGETQRIYNEIYLCIEELLEDIEFTKDN